jgi:hypothetical protein
MKRLMMVLAGIGMAACAGADDPAWEGAPRQQDTMEGTSELEGSFDVIHTERLSNGNVVEFLELSAEPGLLLIAESGAVPNRPIVPPRATTVTEVFSSIRPDAPVPEALLSAQRRQDRLVASGALEEIELESTLPRSNGAAESGTVGDPALRDRGHCPLTFFREEICDPIYGFHHDYTWEWINRNADTTRSLDNIRWSHRSAACVDQGQVTFEVKARRALVWRSEFSRDITEGHWQRYQYSTGGNNTDFSSIVKNVGSSDWYHTCGGTNDSPWNAPPR